MIIVGAGVAGLSASLASIERIVERGADDARIAVLERASRLDRGGNTRYSTATFRMKDVHTINDDFIDRLRAKTDATEEYIQVLARQAPEAVLWAEGHGLEFAPGPRVFLTSSDTRIQPEGAGAAIVRHSSRGWRTLPGAGSSDRTTTGHSPSKSSTRRPPSASCLTRKAP
ncbi:MAG: FAD-binding protein [Acidimicrobiia bacterium]|nr:FAD-binding protein [Acidimicrobiia bacterium]